MPRYTSASPYNPFNATPPGNLPLFPKGNMSNTICKKCGNSVAVKINGIHDTIHQSCRECMMIYIKKH